MRAVLYGKTAAHSEARLRAELGSEWTVIALPEEGGASALEALRSADAWIGLRLPPGASRLAPNLKLVQCIGAGVDSFDQGDLPEGCSLCNVYEHEVPIAEYVLGAMLYTLVRFDRYDAALKTGRWIGSGRHDGAVHGELNGKTLGLIGFGHIGREIARRAGAFNMRVRAIRRRADQEQPSDLKLEWLRGVEALPQLFAESDFIVVACPLTAETRGMIDAAVLAQARPTSYLINVARAEIVDEAALYAALRSNRLAGAVLDVWYQYPDNVDGSHFPALLPFHELPNVVMTPHLSAHTQEMLDRRWRRIVENLERLGRGESLVNVVAVGSAREAVGQ